MKLHGDKFAFEQAVRGASRHFNMQPALVEKDYFVTLILNKINERTPGLIFKGGTSLSKCYKIIDRFSEDIDLSLDADHLTQGKRKRLKTNILEVCDELGFALLNKEETQSRREFNSYRIEYPISFPSSAVQPLLLVETTFIQKSYPDEIRPANSLIGEWLRAIDNEAAIRQYELDPFEIRVQKPERTLIDKVFAICDYMERDATLRQSRHIYDISRLLEHIALNDDLKALVRQVRAERKQNSTCVSAQDGVGVPALLRKIIDAQVYKKDYTTVTLKLLSKSLSYDDAIAALKQIADSGVFE